MVYFMINNNDYSKYVSNLKVAKENLFASEPTADGIIQARYINSHKIIEVAIIPLDAEAMVNIQRDIDEFAVRVSFLNPTTNALETIDCYISNFITEYYTIQNSNTKFKAFTITFTEARTTPPDDWGLDS